MIPTFFAFILLIVIAIVTGCAAAIESDASKQDKLAFISILSVLIIIFLAINAAIYGVTLFSHFHDQSGNYYLFYHENETFEKVGNQYYTKVLRFEPVIYKGNLFYYSEYIDIKDAKMVIISNNITRTYYVQNAIPIIDDKNITVILDGFTFIQKSRIVS